MGIDIAKKCPHHRSTQLIRVIENKKVSLLAPPKYEAAEYGQQLIGKRNVVEMARADGEWYWKFSQVEQD